MSVTSGIALEGDAQSAVDPAAITELVALAKADKREDFDFLAGAVGVPPERREALWSGTRARLNKPTEDARETWPDEHRQSIQRGMMFSLPQDATHWIIDDAVDFVTITPMSGWWRSEPPPSTTEPPALRNGQRRPRGYHERPRWQDRRAGRERAWE